MLCHAVPCYAMLCGTMFCLLWNGQSFIDNILLERWYWGLGCALFKLILFWDSFCPPFSIFQKILNVLSFTFIFWIEFLKFIFGLSEIMTRSLLNNHFWIISDTLRYEYPTLQAPGQIHDSNLSGVIWDDWSFLLSWIILDSLSFFWYLRLAWWFFRDAQRFFWNHSRFGRFFLSLFNIVSWIVICGISCALPNDALRVCQEYEILDDSHEMSFLFGISLYNTTKTLISLIFDFQL